MKNFTQRPRMKSQRSQSDEIQDIYLRTLRELLHYGQTLIKNPDELLYLNKSIKK